jgi:hypothetical protein
MMFLDCPAYLDQEGVARCGLPAEVRCRFTMRSADGPLERAMIRCPAGHHFSGSIESLTWDRGGEAARRDLRGSPRRHARRPNSAPAYYLGHPAGQWIASMRPRRWLAIGARVR